MSTRKGPLALLAFLLLVPWSVAQDSPFSQKPKPKPPEPAPGAAAPADNKAEEPAHLKGLSYRSNYDKALEYIKKNFGGQDWRTVPDLFSGLVFLLDGREELHPQLEKAIIIAKRKIKDDKAFNGNWFVAYSALFLAIVYTHEKLPDVKQALEEGFQVAMHTREDDTHGWGHNKGWGKSSGYYKRGGGIDLGSVTSTMLAAALIARENGVTVPKELIEGAAANLASIGRGGLVSYGTGNGFYGCISRSAQAFVGFQYAKNTSNPICGAVAERLPREAAQTENGHAYGPIHFFANTVAAQMMGQFAVMGNHWLPVLSQRQQADGSVAMQHDGGKRGTEKGELGSTAVYALMILMQKQKLVQPPGAKAGGGGPSGQSPFSQKRPKVDEKDVPTPSKAPTGPTTGDGGKE
jgi:hypothetical protein